MGNATATTNSVNGGVFKGVCSKGCVQAGVQIDRTAQEQQLRFRSTIKAESKPSRCRLPALAIAEAPGGDGLGVVVPWLWIGSMGFCSMGFCP